MADLKNMNDKLNTIEGTIKNPPIDMISMDERIGALENKNPTVIYLSDHANASPPNAITKVIATGLNDKSKITGEVNYYSSKYGSNLTPTKINQTGLGWTKKIPYGSNYIDFYTSGTDLKISARGLWCGSITIY